MGKQAHGVIKFSPYLKKKKKCSLIAICPTLERPSCGKARAATGRRAPKAQNAKPASQRKRIVKDARSMEAAII